MNAVLKTVAAAAILTVGLAQNANAGPVVFKVDLNGANESPANASPAVGSAVIAYDVDVHTMTLHLTFSDLSAPTTAAHLHCCTAVPGVGTAGVATTTPFFAGFPIGVTSGTFDIILDLTAAASYNAAFITSHGGTIASAEAALVQGAKDGEEYLNVHTQAFGGGEIRGFLAEIPEPATLAIFGFGLAALGFVRRRRSPRA